MLAIDPSAVLWSAPERERAGRPVLVLAHGRGADERDLFGLSPHLPLEPVIAAVRAPIAEGPGFSWFDARLGGPDALPGSAVDDTAQALLAWLDGVDTSAGVGVLGFSQGACVATQVLRLAPRRLDYAVALSGWVARDEPGTEHPGDVRLRELPPPLFWGRGADDPMIPSAAVEWSIPWYATHTTLTERVYRGLGHGVSPGEVDDIGSWIRSRLAVSS